MRAAACGLEARHYSAGVFGSGDERQQWQRGPQQCRRDDLESMADFRACCAACAAMIE
jgi:hypothetical protein